MTIKKSFSGRGQTSARGRGWLLAVMALMGLGGGAVAQEKSAAPKSGERLQPASHPIAIQYARWGAFSCAERANEIAAFIATGASGAGASYIQPPPDQPNRRLLTASLAMPYGQAGTAFSTITVAPNQANGCGGNYQTVSYVENKPCKQAVAEAYKQVKFQPLPGTNVLVGALHAQASIFSMDAGRGCILIKQEIAR